MNACGTYVILMRGGVPYAAFNSKQSKSKRCMCPVMDVVFRVTIDDCRLEVCCRGFCGSPLLSASKPVTSRWII